MSNTPKKVKICTICCKPIGREGIINRTRQGTIWVHLECFKAEQEERRTERLMREGKA